MAYWFQTVLEKANGGLIREWGVEGLDSHPHHPDIVAFIQTVREDSFVGCISWLRKGLKTIGTIYFLISRCRNWSSEW